MRALPSSYSTLAVPYEFAAMGVPRKLRSDFRPSSYENIEIWLRTSELAIACDWDTFWANACADATREIQHERTATNGLFMGSPPLAYARDCRPGYRGLPSDLGRTHSGRSVSRRRPDADSMTRRCDLRPISRW